MSMRIDKFISNMGIASRKETALAAKKGGLLVNGTVVKDVSRHVNPDCDKVVFLGREISFSEYVYVMLNKPEGFVSATEDKSLPYVTELLPEQMRKMELFPVGRLDRDTVGLMVLTNDGKLSHALLSPKRHVSKKYRFTAAEPLPDGCEEKFKSGVVLRDGYECKEAEILLDEGRMSGEITLTEGKYHQIKRMIASFGNRVTSLERVEFAEIPLDDSLRRGEWRYLTENEINMLKSKAK